MTTAAAPRHQGLDRLVERANGGDQEAGAVLVLLSHPVLRGKASPYVDPDGIRFAAMLGAHDELDANERSCPTWETAEPYTTDQVRRGCKCGPYLSSSERLMLQLAWNLWNGSSRNAVDVSDLLCRLDDGTLGLVLEALEVRRGRPLPYPGARS